METRDRVYLPILRTGHEGGTAVPVTDVGQLLMHMLLFERIILKTHRLLEVVALARELGVDAARLLLESQRIRLECDQAIFGTIGRTDDLVDIRFAAPPADSARQYVSTSLMELRQLGLERKAARKFKDRVVASLTPTRDRTRGDNVILQTKRDIISNSLLVGKAVEVALRRAGLENRAVGPEASIVVADGEQMIRLAFKESQLTDDEHRATATAAVNAINRLNNGFSLMQSYDAVTGIADDSRSLFDSKMEFLFSGQDPERQASSLQRFVEVTGIPDLLTEGAPRAVDIERFLEVCASQECHEFRGFLREAAPLSDKELRDRASSIRARLGKIARSGPGKAIRFVVTTGIGIVNPLAGAGASLADSFLLEKVLPTDGIVGFVGDLYPSCFKSPS